VLRSLSVILKSNHAYIWKDNIKIRLIGMEYLGTASCTMTMKVQVPLTKQVSFFANGATFRA
jgi:hypothetical protein